MKIDHQEIHSSILNFLELLESEIPIEVESLELVLDKLALMCHFVGEIPDDENKYPEAPVRDYSRWRTLLEKRFPNLGYGNDYLAYIANELSEVAWRWQNNSESDALWHLRFNYEMLWESQLRTLHLF